MGRPIKNLSGKKFGRWRVLFRDSNAKTGAGAHPKWMCICECGHIGSIFGTLLVQGLSRSCGCLQSEQVSTRNTKHGRYYDKSYQRHVSATKRARKIRATPTWADNNAIRSIYEACPPHCHVDHIIPLTSDSVCGLHCEENLQFLPIKENLKKRNKFVESMIYA